MNSCHLSVVPPSPSLHPSRVLLLLYPGEGPLLSSLRLIDRPNPIWLLALLSSLFTRKSTPSPLFYQLIPFFHSIHSSLLSSILLPLTYPSSLFILMLFQMRCLILLLYLFQPSLPYPNKIPISRFFFSILYWFNIAESFTISIENGHLVEKAVKYSRDEMNRRESPPFRLDYSTSPWSNPSIQPLTRSHWNQERTNWSIRYDHNW